MVSKRLLLDITTNMAMELDDLRRELEALTEKVKKLEKGNKPTEKKAKLTKKSKVTAGPKRGRGRPRKNQ